MKPTSLFFYEPSSTLEPLETEDKSFFPNVDIEQPEPTSETQSRNSNNDEPVLILPVERVRRYFKPEQSWEGMVTEVLDDSFCARLVDMENPEQEEEAEILLSAITDSDDLKLLVPGAIFFWTIGYQVKGRRSEQVSLIQFRRLPIWTAQEVQSAKHEALELRKRLGW